MKYKIAFTQSFKNMLKHTINQYKTFSSTYATKIEKCVYESINFLSSFPFCTPSIKFTDKPGNYRKFIIKKRFIIVFKIVKNTIYLLYFIDGRQSPKNYFKNIKN